MAILPIDRDKRKYYSMEYPRMEASLNQLLRDNGRKGSQGQHLLGEFREVAAAQRTKLFLSLNHLQRWWWSNRTSLGIDSAVECCPAGWGGHDHRWTTFLRSWMAMEAMPRFMWMMFVLLEWVPSPTKCRHCADCPEESKEVVAK